jgi:Flp pilus assembly pilin Flp
MKALKLFSKKLARDQKGQGTAEYVLLIAIVVGALVMFGGPLKKKITDKWNEVSSQMDQVGQ